MWDVKDAGLTRQGDKVTVKVVLVRSTITPTAIEVNEGDTVTIALTNIEQTTDELHGFGLLDYNINVVVDPGETKTVTFKAKTGVYPYYCTNFCSALHQEMQGYLIVNKKIGLGAQGLRELAMQAILERADRFLEKELDLKERALVVVAALMLAAVYLFPLWNLTMFAPQYPDGLRMNIYSYKLEGGNHGQDIKEINLLNHYIGMKDLVAEDFTEFKWMPFVVGAIGLLFLRTAVHGRMASLLDVIVLYGYFAAFSLWSFAYKLYSYGHNLAPTAAVKVGALHAAAVRPQAARELRGLLVPGGRHPMRWDCRSSCSLSAFWLAWHDKPARPPRSWEQL